ncbi:Clp protease ClpP [Empedobacter falsenii]
MRHQIIYDVIFTAENNVLKCIGTIWNGDGEQFIRVWQMVENSYDNIIIKLHTDGGSVFDGNLIFNAFNSSKKNIEIHIIGIAASMGAVISQSTQKVYMVENGFMMIHAPSGFVYGTAPEFEKYAILLREIESNFSKKLQKITGKPKEYVDKWLTGDNWFSAEQALKENLIAGIIEPETEVERFDPTQLESKNEAFAKFAALYIPNNVNNNSTNEEMKKPLIQALGLQGVNEQSSDTAVIEAVQQHYEAENSQMKKDLEAEKKKTADLQAKLDAQTDNEIKAFLDEKETAKAFKKEDRATYESIGKTSGLEALRTVLGNSTPTQRLSITSQIQDQGNLDQNGERANWTFAQWQEKDPKGLEKMSQDKPDEFKTLFNNKNK